MSETIQPPSDSLVGLFGHTFPGPSQGRCWQFEVKREVAGRYGLQLFSWLTGAPTEIRFLTADEVFALNPVFYATREEWLLAGGGS